VAIITRTGKGAPLTYGELDGNWNDLDARTAEGWRDLVAPISAAGAPPSSAATATNFGPAATPQRRQFAFGIDDYMFIEPFHIDHDIKPNGLAYLHVHWSTSGTDTGNVRWEFNVQRALGHNQANFAAPIQKYVEQAAAGTAWRHMIAEVDVADAMTLTEPDELILVTLRRVAPLTGTNSDTVFGLMVDLHYEVDRFATPNKSPNFYA